MSECLRNALRSSLLNKAPPSLGDPDSRDARSSVKKRGKFTNEFAAGQTWRSPVTQDNCMNAASRRDKVHRGLRGAKTWTTLLSQDCAALHPGLFSPPPLREGRSR